MYRHIVLFRFDPKTSEDDRLRATEAIAKMAETVPVVQALTVGQGASGDPPNFDLVVEVDLDRPEDLPAFLAADGHVSAWTDVVQPMVTEVAVVDYNVGAYQPVDLVMASPETRTGDQALPVSQ